MPEDPIIEESKVESGLDLSKVAEALNMQNNPLENPLNQEFVMQPLFEEEVAEVKNEEGVVVEAEIKPELNEDGTVKTPVVEVKPEIVEEKAVDFVELLNTAINDPDISFGSVEEIKAVIAENRKFKELEAQYQELSQEERARLEIGRESGDFGLFDRVMGIDTSKISHKEALRQVFMLDNLDGNPQYLEKKFEKDFIKSYEEEADEDFSKLELENNGRKAIDKLIELQADLKKRGQVSGGTNPEDVKKAKVEADNKWFADVDNVMSKSDRVTYKLEDGLEINIVMDANDKKFIQDAMDRPVEYLKSLITDDKGQYDHDALFEFIVRNEYYENALEEARKSGAANREEKILKEKKNAVIESVKAGDTGVETKLNDQLANNFRQLISNH